MKIKHLIMTAALTVVGAAAGASVVGAGTATAPEPARLAVGLHAATGAAASATYTYSNTPTNVRYYIGSWTSDAYGPAAGTPCSNVALAMNATTYKVIQVNGTYRRCY